MASTWVQSRLLSMMMSSCPRWASPSLAVSALGETRIVSSWMRVPRWAWAKAIVVEKDRIKARTAQKIANSQNGKAGSERGTPPPPRLTGIMELGENLEVILGLQSVTGKVLETKELREHSDSLAIDFARALSG